MLGHPSLSVNKELAAIFRKMSTCYRYLGKDQRFRAMAYEMAARTLGNMKEPVSLYKGDMKKLEALKGIGESIAGKIVEYVNTGKIATYEKLKKEVPLQLLDLTEIDGMGPATIRLLHEQAGIQTKEDLLQALEQDRLSGIKGFGEKRINNLQQVLKVKTGRERIPLSEAERIAANVLSELLKIPGVQNATIAGSIRRKKLTIGDIDIVMVAEYKHWKKIINKFTQLPFVKEIKAQGQTRATVLLKEGNIQVDIRVVHDYEYGSALFYFTGSKEHNIQLREMAKKRGWKINEYGVFDLQTGERLAGETEEGIYGLFGFRYIPPWKRTGNDEWALYKKQQQYLTDKAG